MLSSSACLCHHMRYQPARDIISSRRIHIIVHILMYCGMHVSFEADQIIDLSQTQCVSGIKYQVPGSSNMTEKEVKQKNRLLVRLGSFVTKHVIENPHYKWYRRALWTVSLVWAGCVAIQSIPFYTFIGAGEGAYKSGDYATAEEYMKKAYLESQKFGKD